MTPPSPSLAHHTFLCLLPTIPAILSLAPAYTLIALIYNTPALSPAYCSPELSHQLHSKAHCLRRHCKNPMLTECPWRDLSREKVRERLGLGPCLLLINAAASEGGGGKIKIDPASNYLFTCTTVTGGLNGQNSGLFLHHHHHLPPHSSLGCPRFRSTT